MILSINKDVLEEFVGELKKDFDVVDCRFVWQEGVEQKMSFKKHFFPPIEKIFSSDKISGEIKTEDIREKKLVLFGLSLPDIEAIVQLDEIMSVPEEDSFYFRRRKKTLVVGLVREEVDVVAGGDVILKLVNENTYNIVINTHRGRNFIKQYKDFFVDKKIENIQVEKDTPQISQVFSLGEWTKSMRELLLDSEVLSNAVEWSWSVKHKIWDELAEKCLGCGVCTYVCPICHCFSIEDTVGLDDKCSRCRKWDACTLSGFAKIAGGHSFRPTIKERYYNWFYHKFVRAYNEFGKSQCVGCGRCKHNCPAGIDIQKVLREILEDYKKYKDENGTV